MYILTISPCIHEADSTRRGFLRLTALTRKISSCEFASFNEYVCVSRKLSLIIIKSTRTVVRRGNREGASQLNNARSPAFSRVTLLFLSNYIECTLCATVVHLDRYPVTRVIESCESRFRRKVNPGHTRKFHTRARLSGRI